MDFLSFEKGSVITPREVVKACLSEKRVTEKSLALDDVALITFTRRDLLALVGEMGARRVKAWSGRNDRLYRGTGCIVTQSRYGAPNAVILLEELAAFGVNHYLPKGMSCHADHDSQRIIHMGLLECGIEPYRGVCWTTDALYRETAEKITRYRSMGVLGVDMETSAVFCLGIFRNIRVGSAMVVSDRFSESSWEGGFSSEKVAKTMGVVCGAMVKQIGSLRNL
jgi:uridine phosphorylase